MSFKRLLRRLFPEKELLEDVFLLGDVAFFLAEIAAKKGWQPLDGNNYVKSDKATRLEFSAYIKNKGVSFEFGIKKHESQPVWLVSKFEVSGDWNLRGNWVLLHRGKNLAVRDHTRNDFKTKDVDRFWTVKNTDDIKELLMLFDELQKHYKINPVFNLPPEG